ncbi:MAG: lipase family protein [Myxococcota bacterium]
MLTALLLACRVEPVPGIDPQIDLPAPRCLDHAYLSIDGLGELVFARPDEALSFTPDEFEAILDVLGDDIGLAPFQHAVDTWQIRYATQDRGEPAQGTGVVVVPRDLPGPHPVVLWLHPTAGANDVCAPSGLGVYGAGLPLAIAAHLGVVVVAPDFLGLSHGPPASTSLHPYVVPEPTAIAALDAVRATRRLAEREGFDVLTEAFVPWGVSQGGHAALWVDRYQPGYAPELGIAGVVAAIPPTDMLRLFERASTSFSRASEALPAVMIATSDWYSLDATALLQPGIADTVRDAMESGCDVLDPAGELDDLDALFTEGLREGDLPDDWRCALEDNRITTSPLQPSGAPMLVILGEDDQLAWSDIARADAETLCAEGARIELLECAASDHEDAGIRTFFVQEAWAAERFAGRDITGSCELPGPAACPEL